MIYVQLRARVKLAQGETLHVADAAKVLGSEKAGHCSLFCPTSPGVYTLDAIAVAKALKKVFPQEDISLIGADVCYVHRIKARGKDFLRPVRTAAALLIARQRFGADVVSRRREHAAGAGGCLRCHHRRAAGRRASHHHPLLHRRCAGRMRVLRDSLPASNNALGGQADRVSGGHGESRGEAD